MSPRRTREEKRGLGEKKSGVYVASQTKPSTRGSNLCRPFIEKSQTMAQIWEKNQLPGPTDGEIEIEIAGIETSDSTTGLSSSMDSKANKKKAVNRLKSRIQHVMQRNFTHDAFSALLELEAQNKDLKSENKDLRTQINDLKTEIKDLEMSKKLNEELRVALRGEKSVEQENIERPPLETAMAALSMNRNESTTEQYPNAVVLAQMAPYITLSAPAENDVHDVHFSNNAFPQSSAAASTAVDTVMYTNSMPDGAHSQPTTAPHGQAKAHSTLRWQKSYRQISSKTSSFLTRDSTHTQCSGARDSLRTLDML